MNNRNKCLNLHLLTTFGHHEKSIHIDIGGSMYVASFLLRSEAGGGGMCGG